MRGRIADCPKRCETAIELEPAKRSDGQRQAVRDYFVRYVYARRRATFDPLNAQTRRARKGARPIWKRRSRSRWSWRKCRSRARRSCWCAAISAAKGDKVAPGVPASLPPLPAGAPGNRLGLAHWLVDPDNPLVGPRDGEPLLAAVFRHRHRQDERRLRLAGRMAQPSRIARLAGHRVRRQRLGRQSAAEADRDVGHLSAVVAGRRRTARARSRTTGCWPAGRGSGSTPR